MTHNTVHENISEPGNFDATDSTPGGHEGADPYAGGRDTTEGRVYTVTGGDWDAMAGSAVEDESERIVVNMGPQHPSTHGVLRLILEIEGETVTEARCGVGYLRTGIEKNMEYRSWVQGTTLVTSRRCSTRRPTACPSCGCWASRTRSRSGPTSSA